MVAKGVIARTVEHLWDTGKRIDIVYICSNSQIARQNLSRLNVVDGFEVRHADRLTLLPKVVRNLRDQRVNFVSFTPGTSFEVGSSGGAYPERVLLYWMLAACWGSAVTGGGSLEAVLRGRDESRAISRASSRFRPRPASTRTCASRSPSAIANATGTGRRPAARRAGSLRAGIQPTCAANPKVTSDGAGTASSADCASWSPGPRSTTWNQTW